MKEDEKDEERWRNDNDDDGLAAVPYIRMGSNKIEALPPIKSALTLLASIASPLYEPL